MIKIKYQYEKENKPFAIQKMTEVLKNYGPMDAKSLRSRMEEFGFHQDLSRATIAHMWDNGLINVSNNQLIILVDDK